jgi:preprotein translocase subunit SecF
MKRLSIDFFKVFYVFVAVSVLAIGYTLFTAVTEGFKTSTDFSGGVELAFSFEKEVAMDELKSSFKEKGVVCNIQKSLNKKNRYFLSRTISDGEDAVVVDKQLRSVIDSAFPDAGVNYEKTRLISGVVSKENKSAAVKVLIWALIGIILYITLRFKFHYALAAIIALTHDIIIMLGAILLADKEISILTITALLTIVGYSVNDTIILFDRMRENIKLNITGADNVRELLNTSISQVISRTLITSLTTLIVVVALFNFSTGSLHDFAFALIVGLISGTYSSIYIAGGYMFLFKKTKV